MKISTIRFILPMLFAFLSYQGLACTGGTYSGTLVTTGSWATQAVVAGQYYEFTGQAGENYIFTFCSNGGSAGWDTQISILDNNGTEIAYNDDYCGLQSYLSWYAPSTGTYRVLVSQYYCNNSSGSSGTMAFFGPAIVNDDAGISGIVSPAVPKCNYDTSDIVVIVQNLGLTTLTSCDIKWQVGSSSITTYNFTGSVAPAGGTDTVLIASNYVFSNGDELVVWSENPNGQPDSLTVNDTSSVLLDEGLSGTYSIPNDYASLTAAAAALANYGVCDDVVFEISSGNYNEQVEIGEVVGAGEDATITFTSVTGNAGDVIVNYSSVGSGDNYVVYLNGADWVRFTDVTIRNNSTGTYATAVRLENGAENDMFDGCNIKAGPYAYTGNLLCAVYSYGMNHNLTLTNNRIEKGGYGIYVYGSSTSAKVEDVVIENNIIEDAYYMQNYLWYIDGLEFNHNVVTNDSNIYVSSYGVYMYYIDNMNFIGNYIGTNQSYANIASYGGYAYGVYMYSCLGASNPRGQFTNNCINAGKPGATSYGYYTVYMSQCGILDVHHNSITRRGGNSGYYSAYITGGGAISLLNNSFADYQQGYALYAPGVWTVTESDYNNLYSNGGSLVYFGSSAHSNLQAYQDAEGYDLNSVTTDPDFVDSLACVTCNDTLNNAGTPTTSDDISGNVRSMNTPDIGPLEWVSPASFTLGGDSTYCADEVTIEAGPAQSVTWSVNGNSSNAPTITLTGGTEATTFNVLVSIQTEFCGSGSDNALITLVPNAHLDSTTHICADASTTLNPGGLSSGTYTWSTGAATQSIVVSTPGQYSVTKNVMGCVSSASTIVTQSEAVQILGTEVCSDDLPLNLDATIMNGTAYAWSGGSAPGSAVNTFTTAGPYTVTATDSYGCSSVDSFEVVILEEPNAVISIVSNSGNIYIFDASSSSFLTATSNITWSFGAGASPATSNNVSETVTYPWSNPSNPASYSVSLEINNGCGVDITTLVVAPDPLNVTELESGAFAIYPNPASDVVTIATKDVDAGSIHVLDMSGRTVASLPMSAGTNNHVLNVGDLASGTYIIQVVNDSNTQTQQLIIQ